MSTTSTSTQQHREMATEQGPIAVAIVTVSDTRTPETDKNAVFLREQLAAEGNSVVAYQIIKDEPDQVEAVLDKMAESDAQVILFNGGTGIAPRDTTFDILDRKLEKTLPGFGELFRMFSYDQVGAGGDALTSDCWGLPRESGNLYTRLDCGSAIGMGKVDWTGIGTSGLGSRTLIFNYILRIFNYTLRSNRVGFMFSAFHLSACAVVAGSVSGDKL